MPEAPVETIKPDTPPSPVSEPAEWEHPPEIDELIQSPPPRIVRGLLYGLWVLVVLLIVWAYIGRYDVLVSARGVISTASPAGVLQSTGPGTVGRVLAQDGQAVQPGQPLIEWVPDGKQAPERIAAPIAGTLELADGAQPGQWLSPGEVLGQVLPPGGMVGRIYVANEDVGRVRQGLEVQVKVDAFPYQEYGVLRGRLHSVSLLPETPPGSEPGSPPGAGAWGGPAPPYSAVVTLPSDPATTGRMNLRPGLGLTAEIVVQRRRLLHLLLEKLGVE